MVLWVEGTVYASMSELIEPKLDTLLPLSTAEVFERYADMVYRLAFSRTKSRSDADDVLQDVFVRYVRAATAFSEEEHRKAWLIRVTLRCCASFMTSAWKRRTVTLDQATHHEGELSEAWARDYSDVYEAVMQLPAKYRSVVHLFYYENFSVSEIAGLCALPEATVKTHLYRARERLRHALRDDIPDERQPKGETEK